MGTNANGFVRHWKEHWDPTSDLVFTKKMRLGFDGRQVVLPGDPVTPAMREKLGIHRLKIWWQARFVGRADWAIRKGAALPPALDRARPKPDPRPVPAPVGAPTGSVAPVGVPTGKATGKANRRGA